MTGVEGASLKIWGSHSRSPPLKPKFHNASPLLLKIPLYSQKGLASKPTNKGWGLSECCGASQGYLEYIINWGLNQPDGMNGSESLWVQCLLTLLYFIFWAHCLFPLLILVFKKWEFMLESEIWVAQTVWNWTWHVTGKPGDAVTGRLSESSSIGHKIMGIIWEFEHLRWRDLAFWTLCLFQSFREGAKPKGCLSKKSREMWIRGCLRAKFRENNVNLRFEPLR